MKATIYIQARPPWAFVDEEVAQGYGVALSLNNSLPTGWVNIGEQEVEVTVPDPGNITEVMVGGLREKQQEIRAAAEVKCNEIEDQIAGMLCLTHDGDSA